MEINDISILKQKSYSGSYYHQDTYVVGNTQDTNSHENQTLLASLQNLINKTNFNLLESNSQTYKDDSIQNKILRRSDSERNSTKILKDLPKLNNSQSFNLQENLQDQSRSSSLPKCKNLFQNIKTSPEKLKLIASSLQSPFLSPGFSQNSICSCIFDANTKDKHYGSKRKYNKKFTLKDKLLQSESINRLPKIQNINEIQQKKVEIKKQHLLMEKDYFKEYIDGLQNSNITMSTVMNQLIKRKQIQQEKKNLIIKLQEKDEMSRMSKSIVSHTNSNSTSRSKSNSPKGKTFLNRLSFKVQNLTQSKESQKSYLPEPLINLKTDQNLFESPVVTKKPRFASQKQRSMDIQDSLSPFNRRSMMAQQKSLGLPLVGYQGRSNQKQKTMELKPIQKFTSKGPQNQIAPALQKLIFKQPLKKETKKDNDDSESNDDEYMDDVDDLAVANMNKNYFKKRMNSMRNDVITLQSQLGQYLDQVKNVSEELKNQLDQVVSLFQNEQRIIAVISKIIAELQKNGLGLLATFELKDIFFSENQLKLKASQINLVTIANHVAKQKARQYDQDGNVLPPRVNLEILKALEEITQQLKQVIYKKKVLNLKASEQETKQKILQFTQLKDSYFQSQDSTKQEELTQLLQKYQESRTLIGPECANYNLQPLIEYFHKKFKYNISLDFDKQERKINLNMENIILNLKNQLHETEISKFGRKKKQKKKHKKQSNSSSSQSNESNEKSIEQNDK